jgi:hypothetical protein
MNEETYRLRAPPRRCATVVAGEMQPVAGHGALGAPRSTMRCCAPSGA